MNLEAQQRVTRVEQASEWLVVEFGSGTPQRSAYHFRWLRQHEGLHDGRDRAASHAEDLAPLSVEIRGNALAIAWSDARSTTHDLDWLQAHAYVDARDLPSEPALPTIAALEVSSAGDELQRVRALLATVATHGVAIVRGGAAAEAATDRWLEACVRADLQVRGVQLGQPPTGHEGFTDTGIQLHSCQPYEADPPRYQLLHALVRAPFGGDNVFVDAARTAEWMRATATHDHTLLCSVPVPFVSARGARSVAPMVQPATSSSTFRVRYSAAALAPLALPFGSMASFYRAHDAFTRLLRDPKRALRLSLEAGDLVLYDNHRMVHARTPFEGPRWVRSAYLDEPMRASAG